MSQTEQGQETQSQEPTSSTEDRQDSWRDSLPETLRDAPFFKGANDLDDAVNQLSNAASHMGNSIRIPSEDASPEDQQKYMQKVLEKFPSLMPKPDESNMDSFYQSLGRPNKPDEYKFDLPEGKEVPEDFEAFRKAAYEAGLTQAQFKKVLGDILDPVFQNQELMESEQQDAMKALAKEWGYAYENNVNSLKNFLDTTDAPQGIRDLLENEAMSPEEMKWLYSIAKQIGDPKELAQQRNKADPTLSPADAQDQIQEIMNNPQHAYWNSSDPRHKDAIKKMISLQRMAHPEN